MGEPKNAGAAHSLESCPVRRIPSILILAALLTGAPAAFAQSGDAGPVVDVVEIVGVIDRPIERYAIERIDAAERDGAALLVFQLDSIGALKIAHGQTVPPLVERIATARVPVAVHIGPRGARAAATGALMLQAAHIASMGPSARLERVVPFDLAEVYSVATGAEQVQAVQRIARERGRPLAGVDLFDSYGATAAREAKLVDHVVPSLAELFGRIDGSSVTTAAGDVRLSLPTDETVVRFFQPGPIRRLLHAFANPALAYLCLLVAAALMVFELFQPGFGVAGVTSVLLGAAGLYGLTVLPGQWQFVVALAVSLVLLTIDVARDELLLPTAAGTAGLAVSSFFLFPRGFEATQLSAWLVVPAVFSAFLFFVPGMTVVRRARKPIATAVKAQLVGEPGEVRSMLNPEGFVMVEGEIWRARSEDGSRVRVGESVRVTRIDGTVLMVERLASTNGSATR